MILLWDTSLEDYLARYFFEDKFEVKFEPH